MAITEAAEINAAVLLGGMIGRTDFFCLVER